MAVREVIEERDLVLPVTHDDPWWSVWMSIEHERIHLETSSVLIRQMPVDSVSRPIGWKYAPLTTSEQDVSCHQRKLRSRRLQVVVRLMPKLVWVRPVAGMGGREANLP